MAAEIPFQGVTRRQMVSEDLYNSYEAGDKRKDLTVINGYTSTADGEFIDNELIHFSNETPHGYYAFRFFANNQNNIEISGFPKVWT